MLSQSIKLPKLIFKRLAWNRFERQLRQNSPTPPRLVLSVNHTTPVESKLKTIGKRLNREVYCVDCNAFNAKYIGETEKNLSQLIRFSQQQNYILFFDEADALYGKRTKVKDTHDRFANQDISYLMARLSSANIPAVFVFSKAVDLPKVGFLPMKKAY